MAVPILTLRLYTDPVHVWRLEVEEHGPWDGETSEGVGANAAAALETFAAELRADLAAKAN